jgi:AraC-like DNA-binding protein
MQKDGEIFALDSKPFLIEYANTYYIEKLIRETVDCYEAVPNSPSLLRSKTLEMLMLVSCNEYMYVSATHKAIAPALEYMNKYPYDSVPIENYAKMCSLSYGGFGRLFKKHLGKSPREYIIDNKMAAAKMLLEECELSVKEISDILNFESTSYFCRLFKQRCGTTPSELRKMLKDKI